MFSVLLPPPILYRLAHETHTKLTVFLLMRIAKQFMRIHENTLYIDHKQYNVSKLSHYLQKWVSLSVFQLEDSFQHSLCDKSNNFSATMLFLSSEVNAFETELRQAHTPENLMTTEGLSLKEQTDFILKHT